MPGLAYTQSRGDVKRADCKARSIHIDGLLRAATGTVSFVPGAQSDGETNGHRPHRSLDLAPPDPQHASPRGRRSALSILRKGGWKGEEAVAASASFKSKRRELRPHTPVSETLKVVVAPTPASPLRGLVKQGREPTDGGWVKRHVSSQSAS